MFRQQPPLGCWKAVDSVGQDGWMYLAGAKLQQIGAMAFSSTPTTFQYREFQSSSLPSAGETRRTREPATAKGGKAKGEKEPTKPAYHTFVSMEWHNVREEGDSIGDVAKKMSAMWKGLSDDAKAKYIPKKPRTRSGKRVKAQVGYAAFVKENYNKYRETGDELPTVSKKLAEAWKAMSETQKAQYKPGDEPKKPIRSGYTLFVKDRMAEPRPVGEKSTEAIRRIAGEWKELSEDQKQQWKDRVKVEQ